MHGFLTKGIRSVAYTDAYGAEHNPTIWLIDKRDLANNDYLAARQVMVKDGDRRRIFDVVLYVNGLPLVFLELKKTSAMGDLRKDAHTQLTSTYANGASARVPLQCRLRRDGRSGARAVRRSRRSSTSRHGTWTTRRAGQAPPPR